MMVEIDLCTTTWSLLKRNTKTNGQIMLQMQTIIILRHLGTKSKLDSLIGAWIKDTKVHTCYEDPIHSKCMRSLCYSRPFGVKDSITMFPDITDFEIIMYAEPEYRFNVALPDGTKAGVVAMQQATDN